jgi:D-alanine-D-alanine ligase
VQAVIVEEKIVGSEFVSTIITDTFGKRVLLPPTEIVLEVGQEIFDYDQKYMPGRATKFTPARFSPEITQQIQALTLRIMDVLALDTMVRVDGFVTALGDIVFIDVNTITGMAPSSFFFCQAAEVGLTHAQLINTLIKAELHNYKINY